MVPFHLADLLRLSESVLDASGISDTKHAWRWTSRQGLVVGFLRLSCSEWGHRIVNSPSTMPRVQVEVASVGYYELEQATRFGGGVEGPLWLTPTSG